MKNVSNKKQMILKKQKKKKKKMKNQASIKVLKQEGKIMNFSV